MLGYRANLTREVISRAQWAAVLVVFLILALISCGSNAQSELPVYSTLPLPTPTISPSPSTLQVPISASPSLDNACQVPIDVSVAVLLNELQSCKSTTLSKDSSSIIRLYLELERFKSDPEFHQFGFGACCRFNSWLRELESLSMTTYGETGAAPGDLSTIAFEYQRNAGIRSHLIDAVEADIAFAAKEIMGLRDGLPTPTLDRGLGSEVIGRWRHDMLTRTFVMIISEAGQIRIEQITDRGKLVDPLVEVSSAAGRRFNIVGDPREWYIINRQGNLEIRDHFGLYVTAIKVE